LLPALPFSSLLRLSHQKPTRESFTTIKKCVKGDFSRLRKIWDDLYFSQSALITTSLFFYPQDYLKVPPFLEKMSIFYKRFGFMLSLNHSKIGRNLFTILPGSFPPGLLFENQVLLCDFWLVF
jgi:hypothetical protein